MPPLAHAPQARRRLAVAALAVAVCASPPLRGDARADGLEALVVQVRGGADYKERLGAALNLTRLGDPRAIPALAEVLGRDADRNVRAAAAVGLGKLVTAQVQGEPRARALAALRAAAERDANEVVKAQASRALAAIAATGAGTGDAARPGGGAYVNVGPMASQIGEGDDALRELMRQTTEQTLGRVAREYATTWPGGAPTRAQLDQAHVSGFYVDGTVNQVTVKDAGSGVLVSCKIKMLIASYPEKSMFGFLSGGAAVEAGRAPAELASARTDCVAAVVEDLVSKKIVPTIKNSVAGSAR